MDYRKATRGVKGSYPHLAFRQHWNVSPKALYELGQCNAIIGAICQMPIRPEQHRKLLEVSLIKGAQATTAIEGNTLTAEEVRLVAGGKSLPPSKEYQEIEVRNILDAMNLLLREVTGEDKESHITPEVVLRFHQMIGKDLGEHLDAIPGRFRTDQRVVGPYRCPDPDDVPELVGTLCQWLRDQFQYRRGNQAFADAVIQAIVTHVYIEWIHPFGDGSGRTGRLLEFYILLRAGNPDIASHILSNHYNLTRPEYYRQIDAAHRERDLSAFIEYAVEGFRDGLLETLHRMQESQFASAWRSFIHDRFAERRITKTTVFKRRRELMLSFPVNQAPTLDEIPLLNARIAALFAPLSQRTLKRDLDILVEMDLMTSAEGRYVANTSALRLQLPRRLRRVNSGAPSRVSSEG
ncbi:MAG: Fic family protein [Gemmatimonadota bacterium]|nr:Fic family protein [Gemmatimonadota bacterium]